MSYRLYLLICLAAVAAALRAAAPPFYPAPINPFEAARLFREGNGEALLALGRPIELGRASIFDLERISGVSDRLAGRIMARKGEIIAQAMILPANRKWLALTVVHGIGEKTARALERSLALE